MIASSVANIIKVGIKGKELFINASAPDVGNIEEVMPAEVSGQEKKSIAFNVRLLIDVLRVVGEEDVLMELSAPLSPGLIRPVDGAEYIYIVMPIRTQEAVSA